MVTLCPSRPIVVVPQPAKTPSAQANISRFNALIGGGGGKLNFIAHTL